MSKYKTFEELKEELGNNFDEYMYKLNIELLTKIEKAVEYIEKERFIKDGNLAIFVYLDYNDIEHLLNILNGEEKENG